MIRLAIKFFLILICIFLANTGRAALPIDIEAKKIPSLAPVLKKITPAVVNIATEGRVSIRRNLPFSDPFFQRFFNIPDQPIERKTQSLGSGVIVDAERGLVLTNHHVIANAVQITVTLRDGRQLEAELVGTDPETDVAVVKIPAENLTDIPTADSDSLEVGDFVIAVGNPFGLGQTVTSGIVSALSRSGLGIHGYEDFIQTDASINPGNSGGALVDLSGKLIGINTAIFSRSGGNIGIGFAIPVNLAFQIMEQLLNTGHVTRGFLGVQTQDLSPELAEAFGLQKKQGAVITRVMEDSPAKGAGLEPGDIIITINGKSVKNAADVRNQFGLLPVGEEVLFEILRGGKTKKITTVVTAKKEASTDPLAMNKRLEGITVGDIKESNPLFGKVKGIVIAQIRRGSLAWRNGLRKGDIITSVNRQAVTHIDSFLELVNRQETLLLRILRGNAAAFVVIK